MVFPIFSLRFSTVIRSTLMIEGICSHYNCYKLFFRGELLWTYSAIYSTLYYTPVNI